MLDVDLQDGSYFNLFLIGYLSFRFIESFNSSAQASKQIFNSLGITARGQKSFINFATYQAEEVP